MNLTIKRANDKKHILIAIIIFLLCSIMIGLQPLRVSAEEVSAPISEVGTAVASLYSSGVATYIAAASVGIGAGAVVLGGVPIATAIGICVAVFLVGMGVSLTVSLIAQALNKAYEFGYFQQFIDRVCDAFRNGTLSIKSKLIVGASLFSFMYNWVKTHVVGNYNQNIPNVDLSAAQNGYELLVPSYNFNSIPNDTQILENVNKPYANMSITLADFEGLGSSPLTKSTNVVTITNPNTKLKYGLQGEINFTYSGSNYYYYHYINKIILSENVTLSCDVNVGEGGRGLLASTTRSSVITFNQPFEYKANDYGMLWLNTYYIPSDNGVTRDKVIVTPYNRNSATYRYYLNGYQLTTSGSTIYISSLNKNVVLELDDGTIINTFNGYRNFFYLCTTKVCTIKYIDRTNQEETVVGSNANITYTTVNNYYNSKSDVLSEPADVIGTKVGSGDITDSSEGTLSIGVSDLVGTFVDSIGLSNQSVITDIQNTEITTNGVEVVPSNSVLTVAAALIIAGNNARAGLATIKDKFPFDVIPNVRAWLNNLVRDGQPIVIDYDIDNPLLPTFNVHMDFSRYQYVSIVSRWVLRVGCAIGLLLASRKAFDFI